jgi:hypothetical protein
MSNDLLNLIPNDILNLIWIQITPNYKYFLNKYYLNKYYGYRFFIIHNKKLNNVITLKISNYNNYNYYYYILINDLIYFSKTILTLYITNNISTSKYNTDKYYYNKFVYKNVIFYNLVDFFYYYSNNKSTIINIVNKYNLSHLIKKSHKNNVNKNIRWTL